MSRLLALAAVFATGVSCINVQPIPPDHPCREAGFAIAGRVEECTGDIGLADKRFEQFERDYVCIAVDVTDEQSDIVPPEDLYDCAFAIRELPCELTEAYGNELDRFLALSNACSWVVARKDGHALPTEPP